MNNTLTWLHLSDLHLTCKSKDVDWTVKSINQDIVIHSLLEAIDKLLIQKGQKPDVIFITGDLSQSGKQEEYQVAKEFCNQLLKITGLTKYRLFIVAGNHDVNRAEISDSHINRLYQFNNENEVLEILKEYPFIMDKLKNFYQFTNQYLELNCKSEQHYIIAKPIEFPEKSIKINLLGLNSALFAGYNGDDKQKLAFGLYQAEQAFLNLDNDAQLSIAFFHHPFSCFHECEKPIQNQLKEKVDLILTGHLHDPSNMNQHDSAGKVVIIGAGASYETRNSENSFNFGTLNLETGEGKIQFYKYINAKNRWTKNTDVNLDEEDGCFPFKIDFSQKKTLTEGNKNNISTFSGSETNESIVLHTTSTPSVSCGNQVVKIAILFANPINKKYDYSELLRGFKKLKCEVYYFHLNCVNLNELDGYDYIFILSKLVKGKIIIEDGYLNSQAVSLKELEENIGNTDTKCLFIFLEQLIDNIENTELSLPTIVLPSLSKGDIEKLIFQAFKKCQIPIQGQLVPNGATPIFCELKSNTQEYHFKTHLSESIDPRTTQNFIGRVSDLEILCRKIIDLKDNKNGFLTVKGSGGIGKTHTIKKIAVELAARNIFPDGIDFVECEFLTDYKLFEFNVARTFNLEQAISVKDYIRKHEVKKDSLLILDNFETLLHLPDSDEIKEFLNFICDYITVIVTSRELLDLEYEDFYELRRFTTNEAIELFLNELDRKVSASEEKFLRNEIIETLLDNNPLAIKLITKNLPKGKDFRALKQELEEDIFEKLSDVELNAFDNHPDTNIERKKSLYASINFSYKYLTDAEKIAFELLSLFPDGIHMENLKHIAENNREELRKGKNKDVTHLCINDTIIHALDKKSMIENNNAMIRLQSIVGRFAEQQLNQRQNMQEYYHNAFEYNSFLIDFLTEFKDSNECLSLKYFNSHKNNFLKSVCYIDLFNCEKYKILGYLETVSNRLVDICTNKKFIELLSKKRDYFTDNKNEELYFDLILIWSRYLDGDFEGAFHDLNQKIPRNKIENLDFESELGFDICRGSIFIYSMEGDAFFCAKILEKTRFYNNFYRTELFYIGEYSSKLSDYVKIDFFYLEIKFNCNILSIDKLENYLKSLYKKDYIEIMQCHYVKAKMGYIDKATINKLIIVNSYTQGLQQLIFAFCETDNDKTIELYEEALDNLKHIKYYYVEALYFYAKFLKQQGLEQYADIYQQGFELAKKHYFRFLIYKFENLVEPKTISYEPKDYPLPDNHNFDDYINFLIKKLKHQKH